MNPESKDFREMCVDAETARRMYGEGLDALTFVEDGIKALESSGMPQPALRAQIAKAKARMAAAKRKWGF